MKLTTILLLVTCMHLSASVYSQRTKLNLSFKNTTVREVLKSIEDRSEFFFLYTNEDIDVNRNVTLTLENANIEEILAEIFEGTDVNYKIADRQIILMNDNSESRFAELQQQSTITGVVKSSSGEPIPGATVVVKGTSNGTITDFDGKYTISNVPSDAVLQVSFVGMKVQEIPVAGKTQINVVLEEETIGLEEVVAIGYGVQKKSDVTGATVSVGAEELTSRPVTNAVAAMQGKAAGIDISSNERPGTVGSISIRGVRSLTASNSPLYVVDGIPLVSSTADIQGDDNNEFTFGGIDNLNPNDIESIDILKDASATAIYGSRGANGVVLITTKKGKAGKFTLTFDSSVTIEKVHEYAPLFSAGEYVEYRRWAKYYELASAGTYPRGDEPTLENDAKIFTGDETAFANIEKGWASGTWDGSKLTTTNWTDFVTRTGITTTNTISASGGTEKMTAYGSFGYTDNTGVVKGQSYKRYNGSVSVDVTPTDWFQMGVKLNSSYSIQEFGQSQAGNVAVSVRDNLYDQAYSVFTYTLPYDSDGNKIDYPGGDIAVKTIIDEDKYSQDQRTTVRTFGSFYGMVDIGSILPVLDGLKYRINFGPDMENWRNGVYIDGKSVIRSGSAFALLQKSQRLSYTLDNLLLYNKTVGEHDFGLTLLQSQTKFKSEGSLMSADNIPLESQKWNAFDAVSSLKSWDSNITKSSLLSYMARLTYAYKGKYLLTASGRYDGASQLAEGNKWAFFPSAALGWRIDQEDFMSGAAWVNQLKLRLGVGATGNAAIDPYETKGRLVAVFYPIGSTTTAGQYTDPTLANEDLGWEKTTQYNIGLDFSILNSRISGSLDSYISHTTDLLMQKSIPTVTGYEDTFANIGETKSSGIDLTVNTVNVTTNGFEWTTTLNASYQTNKIVSLANGKEDDINNEWFIGESQDIIYDYEAAGIWQESDAEEMAKFNANGHTFTAGNVRPVDQNGDYKIDANNDRVIIGSEIPKYILGLTNTFTYKGLELSIFMYGRFGYTYDAGGEGLVGRYQQRKINYWTPNNTNSDYQKPIYSAGYGDQYYGSLGFESGSFLKIRNISLGYNLPNMLTDKLGVSKLRFYVQALNPGYVFNKVSFRDMDTKAHYANRGFVMGVNLQF
ncbi:TonB-dependent receptor [Mangrovibacterium diazotrophicum]|nr:TonB-dependent receptor [Mangrovibacterium diazotrophicum]